MLYLFYVLLTGQTVCGKFKKSQLLLDIDSIVTLCFDYSEPYGISICIVDESILTAIDRL